MEGNNGSPKSELQQKIEAARQESKARIIEKDTKRMEVRDAKRAEAERLRAERMKKFVETIDSAKQKVKEFRAWDKKSTLNLFGEIAATPKIAEIGVQTGVEATKKFALDRVNDVVETGKKIENWVEDEGIKINNTVDRTKESIKETVNTGIENTIEAAVVTKDFIVNTHLETVAFAGDQAQKGKEGLIKAWKRVQAIPLDMRASIDEKRAVKIGEKIDREVERYAKISEAAAERRNKAAELKGTRNTLAKELMAA